MYLKPETCTARVQLALGRHIEHTFSEPLTQKTDTNKHFHSITLTPPNKQSQKRPSSTTSSNFKAYQVTI
jgi:hypothetical protein